MNFKQKLLRNTAAAFAIFALANCGGGGGTTSTPVSPTPTPTTPTPTPDPTPAPNPTPAPAPAPTSATISIDISSTLPLVTDSDVNDINSVQTENNSAANAQSIENNTFVLGYVTAVIPENSQNQATGFFGTNSLIDQNDYYRANLIGGEILRLEIAQEASDNPQFDEIDPASGIDLDLELMTTAEVSIAVSNSSTQAVEEIIVPSTGEYLIKVTAAAGSSAYALTLGGDQFESNKVSQVTTKRVAPGRAIVATKPRNSKASGRSSSSKYDAMAYGERVEVSLDSYLPSAFSKQSGSTAKRKTTLRDRQRATLEAIKQVNLKEGREVLVPYVFPKKAQLTSSDRLGLNSDLDPTPSANFQWNLSQVDWTNARTVLDALSISREPVIAVIDSGFLTSHPDLADRIVDQRDFVEAEFDGDGFDAEAEEEVDADDANPEVCHDFHGSHVASIALGASNSQGMLGVYPEARLMALKIGYSKSISPDGTDSEGENCDFLPGDLANAIRYAAQLPLVGASESVPTAPVKADVINLSLSSNTVNPSVLAAINAVTAEGVIVVAAAGNDGGTALGKARNFPAAYDNVIAVAATNISGGQANYSSEYAEVDIAAPGGFVGVDSNSDNLVDGVVGANAFADGGSFTNDLIAIQGTSMATPHVAGGVAMMKAIDSAFTTSDILTMLQQGVLTTDTESAGFDFETGYGIMSLTRMLNAAQGNSAANPVTTLISVNPDQVILDFVNRNGSIVVSKVGTDALSVSSVIDQTSVSWLTITPSTDVDSDGVGTYNLTADTTGLSGNVFSATVRITLSDASTFDIPVTLLREATLPAAPAPIFPSLYSILQQEDENGEFPEVEQDDIRFNVSGDTSSFSFEDQEIGDGFRILVSSDLDGDGIVCEDGEMCGFFPDIDNPSARFELTDDEDVNIEISYLGRTGVIGQTEESSASASIAGANGQVPKQDIAP